MNGIVLRAPRPGDLGWVVHRHGVLYHREYGWGERFEALVARVVADYVQHYDAAKEWAWIAERGGEIVGSVFLTKAGDDTAKLRLLYVEPSARGLGLGRLLVRTCIDGARTRGYRRLELWTNAVLVAARAIYVAEGFSLVHREAHDLFGAREIGETWALDLQAAQ